MQQLKRKLKRIGRPEAAGPCPSCCFVATRSGCWKQMIQKVLGDNGVFIFPVFIGREAQHHNQLIMKASSGHMYTMTCSILGMPVTTVPMALYKGVEVKEARNMIRLVALALADLTAERVLELLENSPMFCVQEKERAAAFSSDKDPLSITQTDSEEDEEPEAKRIKYSPLNLQVYQIPAFNTPKSLSIYPTNTLPNFVNNPLNLANPLAFTTRPPNGETLVKNLHNRYSLPAKLTITPVVNGEVVRYKKNGEVAKKRGPPKGYKRKPKPEKLELSQSFNGALQTQNTILSSLLAANNTTITGVTIHPVPAPILPAPEPVPEIKLPEGTELVELLLDPEDWFPTEPYKMVFSRKKNPKWKDFPYQCEHCFKGYRVASTLITHAAERHGCVPKDFAIPCPCCPHVSTRRKHHKKHLESHESRKHRIFCLYCLPPYDPAEPFVKEPLKYPYDKFPQFWYASEESLRLHKKRKHPYSGMFNVSWFSTWRDTAPNS